MAGEMESVPTVDFRVPGLTVRVITNDEAFADACARLYYERPEPESPPDVVYSVWVDRRFTLGRRHSITLAPECERIVQVTAYYPSLLPALEEDVLRRALDGLRGPCPLRGGAVAWGGRALLVAGEYDDGRNLLVKGLWDRGCAYLSDAVALLSPPAPEILPFPKSLALRRAHQPMVSRRRDGEPFRDLERTTVRYLPPPESPEAGPRPLAALLFPRQERAEVRPLGRAEALDRLVAASYHGPERAGEALPYLLTVASRVPAFEVGVHGLKRATDLVFERVLGEAPPSLAPVPVAAGEEREEAPVG